MPKLITCPECGADAEQEHPSSAGFARRCCLSCTWEETVNVLPAGFRNLADLLTDPELLKPPEPVVPFIAWIERVTLLAAREKLGKSTLAGAAAAAVSAGRAFLGQPTRGGSVLWLALEEHAGDVARRFQRFEATAQGITVGSMTAQPLDDLDTAARALNPTLVVVDTLAALTAGRVDDPSSSSAWTKVMTRLTAVAREAGSAVLLLHHSRKSDGKYRDSSAIGAGCDVLLEMEADAHHPTLRRIAGRGRIAITPQVAVCLVGDRYELVEGGGQDPVERQILSFVGAQPGSSSRAIREGVSGRAETIDVAVQQLFAEGRLINNPDGRGNAYSLAPDTARDTVSPEPSPAEVTVGQGRDTVPDTLGDAACPEPEPQGAKPGHTARNWSLEVPGE